MFFHNQFANVVEWEEFRDDMIFWKWSNDEIKKGSKLIIRPGQNAIFYRNGKIEGVFENEGEFRVDSDIIPFLSTLKGFKFGFNSGMRVEVLFVNTKEFTVRWGTHSPVLIPTPQLPGGMPIRANGTFNFKVNEYVSLIDRIAGVKDSYLVEDVKIRLDSLLDPLLMKWISKEGKDMFNLQANSAEIAKGILDDLDMQLLSIGLTVTGFHVMSFNYPQEIQDMITKTASYGMIGDMRKFQQAAVADSIASGKGQAGSTASDMAGMMMGMNIAKEMLGNQGQEQADGQGQRAGQAGGGQGPGQGQKGGHGQGQGQTGGGQGQGQGLEQAGRQGQGQAGEQSNGSGPGQTQSPRAAGTSAPSAPGGAKPNFCPNCGQKNEGANFCPNCGQKLA